MAPLAYDRTGEGQPLVLVHPLGADRGVWEPVLPYLADHHDCIAVDMPGFGESPEFPEGARATAAEIAGAVAATLDELEIERAHVAGLSLGGWVSLEFAKTERCLSITALCAAGFWRRVLGPRPEVARRTARRLLPVLRPLLRTRRGRRLALRGSMAHPENVPPAAALRLIRAYALSPGFERANHEMRSALFEGLDLISAPVTLAWADRDRSVYPPPHLPPGIHTEVLHDCGHVPTWDDPGRVAEVILHTTGRVVAQSTGRWEGARES
jgi:pimeloyl-ACP methyl ester carboxylesterase